MLIPQIQIQQQPAQISLESPRGRQQLEQPRPDVQMQQIRPELQMERVGSRLEIDQERAWDALALGKNLATMTKIYSMASEMALRGLARVVENGNRMAAIHLPGSPFAEQALDWKRTFPEFDFRGPASVDNVDLYFDPGEVRINAIPGRVELEVGINRPEHMYEPSKVNIYMQQYGKVEIIPPQLDITA